MIEANVSFWCQFIDIYEYWSRSDDKESKFKAADILIAKLKELEPKATMQHVNEVVTHLRISYRKELKKLEQSKESGNETKGFYKPLWFFQYLHFLENEQNNQVLIPSIADCILENSEDFTHKQNTSTNTESPAALSAAWQIQYRSLEAAQQLFARSAISEILHQGALGKLNAHSYTNLKPVPVANIKFWSEFIDILEICPALWDKTIKNPICTHTMKVGSLKLLQKLREIEPKATDANILDVILDMKISYRKELKKLAESKESKSEFGNLYKPSWFFYKLSFLKNHENDELIMPSIYDCIVTDNSTLAEVISDNQPLNTPAALRAVWEAQYHSLDAAQQLFARSAISEILHQGALGQLNADTYATLDQRVITNLEHNN